MRMPIRPTIAVAVLTTLTISLIVGSTAALLMDLRQREFEHASTEALGVAKMLAEQTGETFTAADLALRELQERMRLSSARRFAADSRVLQGLIMERLAELPQLASISIVIPADGSAGASRQEPSAAAANSQCLSAQGRAADGELTIGSPGLSVPPAAGTLPLCRALRDRDGRWRGILAAELRLDYLERLYAV